MDQHRGGGVAPVRMWCRGEARRLARWTEQGCGEDSGVAGMLEMDLMGVGKVDTSGQE